MIYSIINTGHEAEDTDNNSYTDSSINTSIVKAYNNDKNVFYDKFKFTIVFDYVLNERIDDYELVFEEVVDETKFDIPIPHIRVNIG